MQSSVFALIAYRNWTAGRTTTNILSLIDILHSALLNNNSIRCCITGTELLLPYYASLSLMYKNNERARKRSNTIHSSLIRVDKKSTYIHTHTHTFVYVRNRVRNEWMHYIRENKIMNLNNPLSDTDNNEYVARVHVYERIGRVTE